MSDQASSHVTLRFDDAVATLTFDDPVRRNAINEATWRAFPALVGRALARPDTRVIVVRGAGGHFAAGADMAEFDRVLADRASTLAYLDDMAAATAALEAAELPVVALVEGLCIGAGVALALACDIRLASEDARFVVPPAKIGMIYSLADTRRLVTAVGASAAKDMLFSGRTVPAEEALAMRLVDAVHPAASIDAALADKVGAMASLSAWSHAQTKRLVRSIISGSIDDTDETRGIFADAVSGDDHREGVAAFRERRPPRFLPR